MSQASDPPTGLPRLFELERRYDGPYPPEAAIEASALALQLLNEAGEASNFHIERARRSVRFARRHLMQGRTDLARLMIEDARLERDRWHAWRRRGQRADKKTRDVPKLGHE